MRAVERPPRDETRRARASVGLLVVSDHHIALPAIAQHVVLEGNTAVSWPDISQCAMVAATTLTLTCPTKNVTHRNIHVLNQQ